MWRFAVAVLCILLLLVAWRWRCARAGQPGTYDPRRPRSLRETQAEVEAALQARRRHAPHPPRLNSAFHEAIAGGKRLRAVITMEIARALQSHRPTGLAVDPADAAIAIELLHAATLVADDLPEFDNDDTRRGRPAIWKRHGPAVAKLTAITLLSEALRRLVRQVEEVRLRLGGYSTDGVALELLDKFARTLGDVAGGQYWDIVSLPAATDTDEDEVVRQAVTLKTAPLFEAAFAAGWLVGGGELPKSRPQTILPALHDLEDAGRSFGLAFQIADDIGDQEQDRARGTAGRPGRSYALRFGEDAAIDAVEKHLADCQATLQRYGLFTPLWAELFEQVWAMALPPE